jgi:hypothetical protein
MSIVVLWDEDANDFRKYYEVPKTADEVLDFIRDFLKDQPQPEHYGQPDDESQKLWDILAALRGPDADNSGALKSATTAVIRAKVFGLDNEAMNRLCILNPDSQDSVFRRMSHSGDSDHFILHAYSAFKALGLDWDKYNAEHHFIHSSAPRITEVPDEPNKTKD